MDGGAPFDAIRMNPPARPAAAFFRPAGQVLPQLTVLLGGRVNPGVDDLGADTHPCIFTHSTPELQSQPAGDLLRRPTIRQPFDHPVNEPAVGHWVGLVRSGAASACLRVGLMAQIQAISGPTGIQTVAQIRAQVRMIVLGLPSTTSELPGNRGTVHPDPARDLGFTLAPFEKCLDLDTVIDCPMSVMCCQGSATSHDVF